MTTVALVVTGSIAAYKAPVVARGLLAKGFRVVPVMTRSAKEFVGRTTLSGLTGEPVHVDSFEAESGELHVEIAARADAVVVVPATADILARMAAGRADDLATALLLTTTKPVLVAPAMHPGMWSHPATQANVRTLVARGVRFVGPVDGVVASGDHGMGRMAEPEQIIEAIVSAVQGERDLEGRRIVVSAGPTVEDVDPVRFISNRSTGKMGFAIAAAAVRRGAQVTIVAGPVSLVTPPGAVRVDVRSALSMKAALEHALGPDLSGADALVMTAAVGDYRVRETKAEKLKRSAEPLTIELVQNPDILASIGASRASLGKDLPLLVGFAVETGTDEAIKNEGRRKLTAKNVDYVVANPAAEAFGGDDNRAWIVGADDVVEPGRLSKSELADLILDRVVEGLKARAK